LPRLDFKLFGGPTGAQAGVTDQLRGRPALICLWASWCEPCAAELGELNERSAELTARGLTVLALSVDGLYDKRTTLREAAELLDRLQFRLPAGVPGPSLLDKLQAVHDELFDRHSPFPLPCSFLIDAEGRLGAIYRGPVRVASLLEDLGKLSLTGEQRRGAALPFAGWWGVAPPPQRLLPIAESLVEQGWASEAFAYVAENKANMLKSSGYPNLLLSLGQGLMKKGAAREAIVVLKELAESAPKSAPAQFALGEALEAGGDLAGALRQFQQAASLDSKHANARQALASILATARDRSLRNPSEALRWAKEAVALTGENDPAHLDTLAVAHAALGEFARAVELEQRALKLAARGNQHMVPQLESRLKDFQNKRPIP
jgi:tetratricopeptide (TPR) repeat protein